MKLLTILIIFFLVGPGDAQTVPTPTLQESMQGIGAQFKTLSLQIMKSAKVTDQTLADIDKMQVHITDSSLVLPKTANTADLESEYKSYIAELMTLSNDLRKSVADVLAKPDPQDLTLAKGILGKMNALKGKGHSKFIPQ